MIGAGARGEYRIEASGRLEKRGGEIEGRSVSVNEGDTIDGGVATGWVGGGADAYAVFGEIETIEWTGGTRGEILVDGSAYRPGRLSTGSLADVAEAVQPDLGVSQAGDRLADEVLDAGSHLVIAGDRAGGEMRWAVARGSANWVGGVPQEMVDTLVEFTRDGTKVDVIAFAPNGGWTVVAGAKHFTRNVGGGYFDTLTRLQDNGREIMAVAFNPVDWADRRGYVIVHDQGVEHAHVPNELVSKLEEFRSGGDDIYDVAFTASGAWSFVASSGDWTRNVSSGYFDALTNAREAGRTTEAIAFFGSQNRWIIAAEDRFHGAGVPDGLVDRLRGDFGLEGDVDRVDMSGRERFAEGREGSVSSIDIAFPGDDAATEIFYEVIDGMAVVEGDILLGPADQLDEWRQDEQPGSGSAERQGDWVTRGQELNVVQNLDKLWSGGIIPYEFADDLSSTKRAQTDTAARLLTIQTNLTVRRRQGDDNYVLIQPSDGCSSRIGQQGGEQPLNVGPDCHAGNIVHEFLHAAGVFHEQSRSDRDEYVTVNLSNVKIGKRHNFRIARNSQALGPYDYQSIMHYGPGFFSRNDQPTIEAPAGETIGQRDRLSAQDIEGINLLYPGSPGPEYGLGWGDDYYATAAAFGDVDGDGADALAVARRAGENDRFFVMNSPADGTHQSVFSGGSSWGSDAYATDLAFGDIDGDGRDELVVTRRSNVNSRFFVYDDAQAGFSKLHQGGGSWGSGNYATSAAIGDIDGDGRGEVAIGRRSNVNQRFFVFDDASASRPFHKIAGGGGSWGNGNYPRGLAFGDVDADGDEELGVARRAGTNARYFVFDYAGGSLSSIHSGGAPWGSGNHATTIAFGNIDGDPEEEIVVGRRANQNPRYWVIDSRSDGFATLSRGGQDWGSGYWTVGVAIEDFDGDGRGEVAIARNAGENGRFFLRDDAVSGFSGIPLTGRIWPEDVGATDIAMGDADGDGDADVAVTRREQIEGRTRYEVMKAN